MFVLFFAAFIFLFTVFENIFIVSVWFVVCILALFAIRRRKFIRLCILAFLLAIGSIRMYNLRYNSWQWLSTKDYGLTTVFMWTGQITTRQWQGKYIIKDWNLSYLLVSENDYQIGDQIRIVGNLKQVNSRQLTVNSRVSDAKELLVVSWSLFTNLFHYEFNYDKRLKMKWIQGTIFEQNSIPLLNSNFKIWFIDSLRNWLQSMVQNSYGNGKTAWLVLGMLIGDKSQIPKSDYQSFIDSGLVHLIAVSWWNIIMIVVFLWFILLRLPFYFRNFVILLCIVIYGFLCGMDSSVFRAVIMWWLWMIALFRGRQIDIRRSLSLAFIGMLLYNPYYLVYDVGFLFSFSAIIGLIYFWKINLDSNTKESVQSSWAKAKDLDSLLCSEWQARDSIRSKAIKATREAWTYVWKNYLSPSVWATLGILPTMIFFMGKINLLGVIGNLLVLPIVPFVMIYGFISTVLYQIFPRYGFIQIEARLIQYIYRVSEKVWEFWLYMNVEGDRIKYLILATAIVRFILKRMRRHCEKHSDEAIWRN